MTYEELMQKQKRDGLMDGQPSMFRNLGMQPDNGLMRFLHDQFAIPEDLTPISQQTPEQLGMNNMQRFSEQVQAMHPMDQAAMATSSVPFVGDAIGLMADARTLWNEPEQRTPMNYGLSALGALPFIPSLGMVKAWHGTPHKVDKFSMDNIGTGEGAQSYGHGLYFAESPDVAKQYKEVLEVKEFTDDAGNVFDVPDWLDDSNITGARFPIHTDYDIDPEDAIKTLDFNIKRAERNGANVDIDSAKRLSEGLKSGAVHQRKQGSLYSVNLDVEPEDLLDWDAPLSEQPKKIQELINNLKSEGELTSTANFESGESLYHWLTGRKGGGEMEAGSNYLNQQGIKGIQYYDGVSRKAGAGTRNYVMFDDELISINRDAFDATTTDMPFYDNLIQSIGDDYKTNYFNKEKGIDFNMSEMTPDDYLSTVDSGFSHGVMSGIDQSKVDRYAEKMLNGEKFPALTLDYSSGRLSQEGRHRSLAAKKAGINSVPVLTVKRNKHY
jgi:hypothetical protein